MLKLKKCVKMQLLVLFCSTMLILGITQATLSANAEDVSLLTIDTAKTVVQYQSDAAISLADIYVYINNDPLPVAANTLPGAEIQQFGDNQVGWKAVILTYGGIATTYRVKIVPKTPQNYEVQKLDFDTLRGLLPAEPGITGVEFSYRTDGSADAVSMDFSTTTDTAGSFYDDATLLAPGHTYWFKVRTYQDVNGERFFSDWSPEKAAALPALKGYEQWRLEAKRQLLAHGVYTRERLDIIMNILWHESRGYEEAGAGRYYVGLMQFGEQWPHNYDQAYFASHGILNYQTDNRLSGSWSLHQVAHLIQSGGTEVLKCHWRSTWDL